MPDGDGRNALTESVRDAQWIASQVDALAESLTREMKAELDELVLAGIRTRGAVLAERLRDRIRQATGARPPIVYLDIAFYRDDYATAGPVIESHGTEIAVSIDDRPVVLIDDVLHTGRTVRAALDLLIRRCD